MQLILHTPLKNSGKVSFCLKLPALKQPETICLALHEKFNILISCPNTGNTEFLN